MLEQKKKTLNCYKINFMPEIDTNRAIDKERGCN